MKKIFSAALLTCAVTLAYASTSTPTLLEVPITYQADASVNEKVRTECQIEDMLAHDIAPMMAKLNKGGDGTTSGSDTSGAKVLRLQITHVLGIGGGGMTGPKAITVSADLLENGKVTRQTKINRWSIGGMFGGFRGTCSILNRSAKAIAKDLGHWANDPTYVIKEEAAPKESEAVSTESANAGKTE